MKILAQISRVLIGSLFIFSGLVKLNDPYGTAYMLEDYFEVFASDFSPIFHHFVPFALFLSVVICAFEVILGIAILLQYKMRKTIVVALLLTVFFTFLTFYSYYFDKVKECGCFGTFIPMTPKESFYKNIITLVFIGILFIRRNHLKPVFPEKAGNLVMGGVSALALGMGYYIVEHLPIVDNLAYKVGNNIPKLMLPEEKPRYKWIMEKDGKEFEFDDANYPTDTAYKYKRYELVGDSTKFIPKIVGFRAEGQDGDHTSEVLSGAKLWVVLPYADKAQTNCEGDCLDKIKGLLKGLENNDQIKPLVLTSHANATIFEEYRHDVQLAVPYYFMDEVLLKTMVRANPGILLVKDGTILGKWHYNDTPDPDLVKELIK